MPPPPSPQARLGCGPGGIRALKSHQWFAGVDFEALASGSAAVRPPDEVAARIKALEPCGVEALAAETFAGDMSWANDF